MTFVTPIRPEAVNDKAAAAHTAAGQPDFDPLKLMTDYKTMEFPSAAKINDKVAVAPTPTGQPDFDPLKLLADYKTTALPGSTTTDSLPKFTLASDTLSLSPEGLRSVAGRLGLFLPEGNPAFPDLDPRLQNIITRRLRMTWDGT